MHLNVAQKNFHQKNIYQDIDSKAYIYHATNFYNTNSFIEKNGSIPYFSLGYAFFLGFLYKIFGINNAIITWIQVLIALLSGFLIFLISKNLFNKKVALIAFAFFSFNAGYLVFSQFILTEIILSFLLVLFLYLFVLFLNNKKIIFIILSSFSLGVSIIVKPAAIYFIFLILIFLLIFLQNTFLYKIKILLLFSTFFYLPILGYMSFNKIHFDQFSLAPLGNENLYFYLFPKVLAEKNKTNIKIETEKLGNMLTGSKLKDKSWLPIKNLFIETFKKDPIIFVKIWLLNTLKTFLGLFSSNLKVLFNSSSFGLNSDKISFFSKSGTFFEKINLYISQGTDSFYIKLIAYFESVWTILRYILCLLAFIFLLLNKKYKLLFFLLIYIFYFSFITGHDGCARFRMMFEPVLIILAAYGFERIWESVKKCKTHIS
ncbi:glycosyltransferase family 39 protein [Candidatus Babeliales bacterium]|nr:glycosyltransferase family 39 protein [Candidatus Babeliales bacterium]